jgi:hypothetical protein
MEEIPTYEEREKIKKAGWDLVKGDNSIYMKSVGMLRVCESHYWRVREQLDGAPLERKYTRMAVGKKYSPGYVLDIDHYTPHWLHAMRESIPADIMEYLKETWGYSPSKCKYLPDGHTIYVF